MKKNLLELSVALVIGSSFLLLGCSTPKWVHHRKENLGTQRTKYETPFTQEPRYETLKMGEEEYLSASPRQEPIINYPTPWKEDKHAPMGIIITDEAGNPIQDLVKSPHTKEDILVDISQFSPGSEVLCPITLKPMRVPFIPKPAEPETLSGTPSEQPQEQPQETQQPPPLQIPRIIQ